MMSQLKYLSNMVQFFFSIRIIYFYMPHPKKPVLKASTSLIAYPLEGIRTPILSNPYQIWELALDA